MEKLTSGGVIWSARVIWVFAPAELKPCLKSSISIDR